MDKAMLISLVVAAIAVAALGATTWLSIKYNGAVRAYENAALDRYKVEAADHAAKLEKEVASATERNAELERTVAQAEERADQAKKHAAELEKQAADAKMQTDEARGALDRSKTTPSRETGRETPNSQIVASLAKYAGTKAAIYAVEEAPDAAEVGSSINAILSEAGWASATWKWTGVSGIVGIVVLTKEGKDPATDEAAAGLVDAFRSAGFNAAKADWPADWRRLRGTLLGPQAPNPTDAPIRVVIGARSR